MKSDRRGFLKITGLATLAGVVQGLYSCNHQVSEDASNISFSENTAPGTDSWESIRANFELDREFIHLAGLLLTSHPKPVREAIAEHRRNLDENPAHYVEDKFSDLAAEVRESAAAYMQVQTTEIALTDSTTMGTALCINGLKIREDQEILTTEFDYYSTHEAIKYKTERSGASFRKIPIYDDIQSVTAEEIIDKLTGEIKDNTRLVTGTWVHSATGLKLPVRQIADRLNEVNSGRSKEDRVLFFVDGVHGLGVEDNAISELGCDFFSAGTHKWMFAPRGTGILWGKGNMQDQVSPTIPTFTNGVGWGGRMSPGGFKAFEHQWAMAQAFKFHDEIGKKRVKERLHALARQLKEGLKEMQHVRLYTPMDDELSSGMAVFDIDEISPQEVVNRLKDQNIIASTTPYNPSYARFTPGIFNSDEEIERTLRAVRELG